MMRSPEEADLFMASWDTASTLGEGSDWSVGTIWAKAGSDYYLVDLERGRFETPQLRRKIIELQEYHALDVTVIEDTELGLALEQELRQETKLKVQLCKPEFDKEARLATQSVRFENGQVFLPKGLPWVESYVNEIIAFPNGRHDDQVDATSQALHWLSERNAYRPPKPIVRVYVPGSQRFPRPRDPWAR